MWEYVELPPESGGLYPGEQWVTQWAAAKMREYDGTIFLCCSRSDRKRRLTFRQAAQALGYSARDAQAVCAAYEADALAKHPGRKALFVHSSMQKYLGKYLDVCPAGARHLLLYSRRHGNGPSPHMSTFMDFWLERGVDIWDLRDIDKAAKPGDQAGGER